MNIELQKQECPTCKTTFNPENALKDHPGDVRRIKNLVRRCSSEDCCWQSTVSEWVNHINVCTEVEILCPEKVIIIFLQAIY